MLYGIRQTMKTICVSKVVHYVRNIMVSVALGMRRQEKLIFLSFASFSHTLNNRYPYISKFFQLCSNQKKQTLLYFQVFQPFSCFSKILPTVIMYAWIFKKYEKVWKAVNSQLFHLFSYPKQKETFIFLSFDFLRIVRKLF